MATGLIDVGIIKPELAGSFAAGYRGAEQARQKAGLVQQETEMNQMKLEQLKQDRASLLQLQNSLKAAGKDPDPIKVFDALIATGNPDYVMKGIDGKRRLTELQRADRMLRQFAPELFDAEPTNAMAPAAPADVPAFGMPAGAQPSGDYTSTQAMGRVPGVVTTPIPESPPMNAMAPAAAPVNAMAPAAAPAAGGDVNALRRQLVALSSIDDPRAKALAEVIKGQITEASKPYVVGGRLVTGAGKELYAAPNTPTTLARLQSEMAALPPGDPRRAQYAALIQKETTHAPSTTVKVNTQLPASEEAQKEFMREIRQTFGALKQASTVLDNIEKAKALVPQAKGFMGAGGESILQAASFLNNRLGTSIDTKGVTSAEELRSRLFLGIMDNLKKLDSQPSQQQQAALQVALGSIGTDPSALPRVLDVFGDTIRQKVELYNEEARGAEGRGVKFPYNPTIKLPPRPAAGGAASTAGRPAGVGADWSFMTDAKGNKAWVSPDNKSFVEVK